LRDRQPRSDRLYVAEVRPHDCRICRLPSLQERTDDAVYLAMKGIKEMIDLQAAIGGDDDEADRLPAVRS
jgi:hypothetical protein